MDKFMDLIPPRYSISVLKEEIENRCDKYYDIIAAPNTTIKDPEMVRALNSLIDAIRLKNALSSLEDLYSDFVKDLTREVKIIVAQVDKL